MRRGRKPDAPDLQAAKGFPGRRQTKVEKQLAEAERLAQLLATAPGSENDPLAPPAFLDRRFAPALAVWKEYAPQLQRSNLLETLDRHTFALFCIWMGEFVTANEDVLRNGYSKMVKTISKDKMPRVNPSVSRRDTAMDYVLELSKRFGLTPLDRYSLLRDQSARPAPTPNQPDLLGNSNTDNPIGALSRMDSAPPVTH